MSGSNNLITLILRKMESKDRDYRFMATSDLLNDLKKDSYKLDDEFQKAVTDALILLLKDRSLDVQNIAMRCLVKLVRLVKEAQTADILHAFCDNMMSGNDSYKNTASIGLKTLIEDLSVEHQTLIALLSKITVAKLLPSMAQDNFDVQLEIFETFSDMLFKFGAYMQLYYEMLLNALFPQISNIRTPLAKRAVNCVAFISKHASDAKFSSICERIFLNLSTQTNPVVIKSFIRALSEVCKQSTGRFAVYVPQAFPLIAEKIQTITDDDLIEISFQTFATFVCECPKQSEPFIEDALAKSIKLLSYDPNYNYVDDENDEDNMDLDDYYGCSDSDDDNSDDDDMTFKVRRGATHFLTSLILTRADLLETFFKTIGPALIFQFREREEYVRVEIHKAYIALLTQTRLYKPSEREALFFPIIREHLKLIVQISERQLKEKSSKTRKSCFALLKEIVKILPDAYYEPNGANYLNNLLPCILYSLKGSGSHANMKIEGLQFMSLLLQTHEPQYFKNFLPGFVMEIGEVIKDPFYRVTIEALLVLTQLVKILRPSLEHPYDESMRPILDMMHKISMSKLRLSNSDDESREQAIVCMAQIICSFADHIDDLSEVFTIFLDRLRCESTRLACLKALRQILTIPNINVEPLFPEAFTLFPQFLRLNNSFVQSYTINLIELVGENYSGYLNDSHSAVLLESLCLMLSEEDLHNANLAIKALTAMVMSHKAFLEIVPRTILPRILFLLRAPLIQSSILREIDSFFLSLMLSSFPGIDYERLTGSIVRSLHALNNPSRDVIDHAAMFCASLSLHDSNNAYRYVNMFIQDQIDPNDHEDPIVRAHFYLLTVGHAGKKLDFSSIVRPIQERIMQVASTDNQNVKDSAAHCLGGVAFGNVEHFLPFILQGVNGQIHPNEEHFMLSALKISLQTALDENSAERFTPFVETIWNNLIHGCDVLQDHNRYVVANCFAKIILLFPQELLPKLIDCASGTSPGLRETVITAFGQMISDYPSSCDSLLVVSLHRFVALWPDEEIDVRRASLNTFNSIVHHKPHLLSVDGLINKFLPHVYEQTKIRTELIRNIEMGPFKHVVDDGYNLRRSGFECMFTLLEKVSDKIDMGEFTTHFIYGLVDNYEIKLRMYLLLRRLVDSHPSIVMERLPEICNAIGQTLREKIRPNSVKQEYEKLNDLRMAAIRAFSSVLTINGADKHQDSIAQLTYITCHAELKPMYEAVLSNRDSHFLEELRRRV